MTPPRIAYLPGDGIGPEVMHVARRVLEAAGFRAEWTEFPFGWKAWQEQGDALPQQTLDGVRELGLAFKGPITSKPGPEAEAALAPPLRGKGLRYRSPIVRLRQELDLGVNLRPVRSWPGNPANVRDDVDLVLFRENTEDVYAGVEADPVPPQVRDAWLAHQPDARLPPDAAVTLRVTTRRAIERVARHAFDHARRHGRRRVTLLEKANVMRATGGLVLDAFHTVATDYPDVASDVQNIDAACALVVREPARFDVVVATNLFGDIFSDLAAELAGGLPLAASANLGERHAVFEPVHGSAPDLAGTGKADPLGAVLAGAMLARHAGQAEAAERVESAVAACVAQGPAGRLLAGCERFLLDALSKSAV